MLPSTIASRSIATVRAGRCGLRDTSLRCASGVPRVDRHALMISRAASVDKREQVFPKGARPRKEREEVKAGGWGSLCQPMYFSSTGATHE